MTWLIGVDEAGYGPNLGPLVVAASLWQLDESLNFANDPSWREQNKSTQPRSANNCDLFQRLAPEIAPTGRSDPRCWLRVDDSKKLFQPSSGLAPLERIVLGASLRATSFATRSRSAPSSNSVLSPLTNPIAWPVLKELFGTASQPNDSLSDSSIFRPSSHSTAPWYDSPLTLPVDVSVDELAQLGVQFEQLLQERGVRLVDVAARVIEPEHFNSECERWGNKAALLSLTTLDLVKDLIDRVPAGEQAEVLCRCDRHGGRAKYAAVLQQTFCDTWIDVLEETSQLSRYRIRSSSDREVEIRFEVGSERFLETAWGSVIAKYLRELAMDAFNDFWIKHLPQLKPTRGYPVDAKRFRSDIEAQATKLKIAESTYWRTR